MIALLSLEARARRLAVDALRGEALEEAAVAFALRRLLAADGDVAVRAAAAEALGRMPRGERAGAEVASWLLDALDDVSPVVRDAAIRALARRREPGCMAALRERAAGDAVWWVRRAAIYALGVIGAGSEAATGAGIDAGSDAAIEAARAALFDPFWRVRHAAVQVLAVCGNRAPGRRDEILASVEGGSGDYLRALWGPALVEDPRAPAVASRLPEPLRDRDPAVVTARLAAMEAPPPLALVELLCDPHVPLRQLAAARLVAAGDAEAFTAALRWLDEPRIPHVAATVIELIDGLGDPARALAEQVLAGPARPGASRWAIGWVAATGDEELAAAAWQRACALGERELAMELAPLEELIAILVESVERALPPAHRLALAAAAELGRRAAADRRRALAAIPIHPSPAVRGRLVAAADPESPHVAAALADGEPMPRALALGLLAAAGRLSPAACEGALADADPAVREAVVAAAAPAALRAHLERERDPWVRRATGLQLAGLAASARRRPGSIEAFDVSIGELALALTLDPDPLLRARGAELLEPARPEQRARLLALAADPSPMVQTAIIEQLMALSDEELAAALPYAAAASPAAAGALTAWLAAGERAPAAAPAPSSGGRTAPAAPRLELPDLAPLRRRLGRSGVEVTPLAISGAFELSSGSLHAAVDAGVELFFWEPTYATLARFLRGRAMRPRTQIVTGSYHADAASIERDVVRALRRLRRDTLDVFLLFWARSPARLDDEAFAALERLKQAGHVRAVGFSTHDRALALAALERNPWDVVMTRHSAAHPGLEAELLPRAAAAGAGVLTFSALCYGRMVSGPNAPSPADCYRYSLSQPGVTACISAPRRHRELMENLEVVARPTLDAAAQAALRAHGEGVRLENQRFGSLIRQPTRDAAAAAMALLSSELPPAEAREPAAGGEPGDPSAPAPPRTAASLGRSLTARNPSRRLRRGRL